MSKLVIQHRAIEAQIKSLQTELAAIEQNPDYAKELAFVDALDGLMKDYGKSLRDVVVILDPDARLAEPARPARGPAPGTARPRLRYKNPHTGEVVETASGNNRVLKDWKNQYPGENIKDWIEGEAK
ncbi:TPA: histone-like nucleoid-structuring protein, MvaT/MvaU family [Pseudomonas aeruginosa]|uniref:histone-like nucleoid-structuring protein, MvaT/MvaU family n=1 Tax=Pseudomonas aeruginosa TaxID=287 RepID=UPI000F52D9B7|nr:histone-like nucleoid-structuring protein, MvaT/MvaU family [Pseudomonas aeruginosa]HBP4970075.1 DNA binding protein [Pseudomonas aeruginosa]HBP6080738.1 H-NS histone [Pseudomonas aeruginosa]HBP6093644.1 H-NS histone [Pseudomonas aeruginosa]HCR1382179.1 DNA binding protein [Pseudomonas aeruginosa]